jgi:hypothetical protein
MQVGPLFHWSPRDCRARITRRGLVPGQKPSRCYGEPDDDGFRQPMVCLSSDPSMAWQLSGRIFAVAGQVWDLWQVQLSPSDAIHTVPSWGGRIHEFRVANRIPQSRLWWVAERTT